MLKGGREKLQKQAKGRAEDEAKHVRSGYGGVQDGTRQHRGQVLACVRCSGLMCWGGAGARRGCVSGEQIHQRRRAAVLPRRATPRGPCAQQVRQGRKKVTVTCGVGVCASKVGAKKWARRLIRAQMQTPAQRERRRRTQRHARAYPSSVARKLRWLTFRRLAFCAGEVAALKPKSLPTFVRATK